MTEPLISKRLVSQGVALILCLSSLGAVGNPLFEHETALKAELSAPLSDTYKQTRSADDDYFSGHFSFADPSGEQRKVTVKTRTRGAFRRRHCERAPLQLNFKKKELGETVLAGQNKLKLVGPCNRGVEYQQLVVLEKLAYHLYDVVSDGPSFAVRALELTFVDVSGKLKPTTAKTFVIEDEKDLAKRHNLMPVAIANARPSELDPHQTAVMELFQYMIGNTDFSPLAGAAGKDCCHNVKLLQSKDPEQGYIPVPYDFDSSGLIDAPYAGPAPKLPIRSVRKRHFMGLCRDPEYFNSAAQQFLERREALYAVFEDSDLEDRYRKRSRQYLDQFFKTLDNTKRLKKLAGKCQG